MSESMYGLILRGTWSSLLRPCMMLMTKAKDFASHGPVTSRRYGFFSGGPGTSVKSSLKAWDARDR